MALMQEKGANGVFEYSSTTAKFPLAEGFEDRLDAMRQSHCSSGRLSKKSEYRVLSRFSDQQKQPFDS
jgi:hypothetical protein